MAKDSPNIVVVSGGLRSPSTTRLLADELSAQVSANLPNANIDMIELRELAHPIADAMLSGFPSGALAQAVENVYASDGLVVVSPTFSGSYSGLFKSFFDILERERLTDLPTLLAATGGSSRHSLMIDHALRPLFTYLGTAPVRTGVFAATQDFGGHSSAELGERIHRSVQEFTRAVTASTRDPQAFEQEVTPFTELLARGD